MSRTSNGLKAFGILLVLSILLFLSGSRAMAGLECENISITYGSCLGCHMAHVNIKAKNQIEKADLKISYDPEKLSFDYDQIPELFMMNSKSLAKEFASLISVDKDNGIISVSLDANGAPPIEAGATGRLFTLVFISKSVDPPEIKIECLGTDLTGWCQLPNCCNITIIPESGNVHPNEAIQFSARQDGFCRGDKTSGNKCYSWGVKADGTGSDIDANGMYKAGSKTGTDTVTVNDACNGNVSDTAVITIVPTSNTTKCDSNNDCIDELFCNGEEGCDEGNDECMPGETPCPEGLCDEDNDVCLIEPPCKIDTDCDDGIFCNGVEICDQNGVCQPGNGNPCIDDGLFCNGEESCDEGNDICMSSGDPCTPPEDCNENDDSCVPPEPLPEPLSFDLIPNTAIRSHWLPLPLFMLIVSTDADTNFNPATTVTFRGDAILSPPWTFVLSEDWIFVISLINPAGFAASDSTDIVVTTTVNEAITREGTANLKMSLLPFILDEKR